MFVCRVLGPLEVTVDGVALDLGGALPRRLVTALIAADGQAVPDDRLIDTIWSGRPPAKAETALQAYVSRLRSALGPAERHRLARANGGYQLLADEVDAQRFEALVASGRAAYDVGHPDRALSDLTEALGLWRGKPFAELTDDGEKSVVEAEVIRLDELREVALEELAAARLAQGDAAGAAAELAQLVKAAPLRERRWVLLATAYYREGRQGDALGAIRQARAVLAEELGVDPGPALLAVEKQVLAQDPRLTGSAFIRRPLNSFLGREHEVGVLTEQLAMHRLVTLVGPAGVGKTRLAVEYAAGLTIEGSTSEDGPWIARLADVQTSSLPEVAGVVARALGLIAVKDDPALAVIRAIDDRSALVVLDNCEHVVGAAGDLVSALTAACPRLRILATSREPLDVDGEITLGVNPLPWATDDDQDAEGKHVGAAVELLVDRVRAVRPGWSPSEADLEQARRIAAELDGLPLAIELAAARARVLGLGEIADRLADRFAVLPPVPRGSLAPHETLRTAIGWSFELLSPRDQAFVVRLWPFEGGFDLTAAEAVWPGADQSPAEVLDSLSSLVTRSVVVADTTVEPTRYLMLESIRAYCRSVDADPAGTLAAQARWVRELAAQTAVAIRGRRAGPQVRLLNRELPNLRAGIAYDLEHEPEQAVRTLAELGMYIYRGMDHPEAIRLLREALAKAPDALAVDRLRVLNILTALSYFAGDRDLTRQLVHEVWAGARQLDEPVGLGATIDQGEVLVLLAFGTAVIGDLELTLEITTYGFDFCQTRGVPRLEFTFQTVRDVALLKDAHRRSDLPELAELAERILATSHGWMRAWGQFVVGEVYLLHPEVGVAPLEVLRESLAAFVVQRDTPYVLNVLRLLACTLGRLDRAEDGVRLLAAVHHHASRLGFGAPGFFEPGRLWVEEELAAGLDPVRRAEAEAAGRALSWQAMTALPG